jgi:hypothetical protein
MISLSKPTTKVSSTSRTGDVNTLKMLGIRLHKYSEPGYNVKKEEVNLTLGKMKEKHTEETNEVYNLIACQISKRQQERVNLFETDSVDQSIHSEEVHHFKNKKGSTLCDLGGHSIESSPGNSPPHMKLDLGD